MSFTQIQQSARFGNGSLTLNTPSSPGTLLVAILFSATLAPVATQQQALFTPPAGAWQFAKAVQSAVARAEVWYMTQNPGQLYSASAAVFTVTGGTIADGWIEEYASPLGTNQILCATGQVGNGSSSGGTTIAATSAAGVFAGSLGLFVQSVQFSNNAATGSNYTQPAGYTGAGKITTGVSVTVQNGYNGNLSAGYQNPTGGFPYTGNGTTIVPTGYLGLFVAFRAVTFTTMGFGGGEGSNALDLDPTGQHVIVGGNVEGPWTSADFGNNWQPADYGFTDGQMNNFADVKWSLLQPGYVYGCCGKTGSGAYGFSVSTDGGCTWTPFFNSTPLVFYGNGTPSPPRPPTNDPQDHDRQSNQLIAQDPVNNLLYVNSANLGIVRSPDFGVTWTSISNPQIGVPGTSSTVYGAAGVFWPRCIIINPANPSELWVGAWDTGNGLGGLYHTVNANASPASAVSWNKIGGFAGTIACLNIIGNHIYAACTYSGIYRCPLASGALVSLNASTPTAVDTTVSVWHTLDGWVDGSGNEQVIAGCSVGKVFGSNPNHTNIIQLTVTSAGLPATYADLTGNHTINIATIPPFGNAWWNAGNTGWHFWLGGSDSEVPFVIVDPVFAAANPNGPQRIYLINSGGFYRSLDGGTTWQLCVNGLTQVAIHKWYPDPNTASHVVTTGDDYNSLDISGDPTGYNGTVASTGAAGSVGTGLIESHGSAFDPVDSRFYLGVNTKYSKPTGGDVGYRGPNAPFTWTPTGYATQVPGAPAVIGMVAGRDGANRRFVVAIAQGAGMFRWRSDAPTTWTQVDSTVSVSGVTGQTCDMDTDNINPALLYVYDRTNGVLTSADYGGTWNLRWKKVTNTTATGWIAAHPVNTGELWVTTDSGLYKLTGLQSGTGIIPSGQVTHTTGVFTTGAAGVVFAPSGALYVTALAGNSPAPAVPTCYVSTDGGSTWADMTNGDGSFGSFGSPPGQLVVTSLGVLLTAAGEHTGAFAYVGAKQGAMSVAGLGQVTIAQAPTHTLASAGVGTVTANSVERAVLSVAGAGLVTPGTTPPPPMITTTTLPSGTVGVVY